MMVSVGALPQGRLKSKSIVKPKYPALGEWCACVSWGPVKTEAGLKRLRQRVTEPLKKKLESGDKETVAFGVRSGQAYVVSVTEIVGILQVSVEVTFTGTGPLLRSKRL
jgi:hypothetical protein